jgi:cardiolipin synthase
MLTKIPNLLTISRILLIPVLILIVYYSNNKSTDIIGGVFFAFACFTDFLDGYLARIYSVQSRLGALLDPLADKLLVASLVIVLVSVGKIHFIPAVAIISREILVSGLREFLATLKIRLPVTNLAKLKTTLQMFSLLLLIVGNRGMGLSYIDLIGGVMLWLAAVLTVVTGYIYFKETMRQLAILEK